MSALYTSGASLPRYVADLVTLCVAHRGQNDYGLAANGYKQLASTEFASYAVKPVGRWDEALVGTNSGRNTNYWIFEILEGTPCLRQSL